MFKVIIWATDGSSGAERALPFAKNLAQAHGARLIIVHVNEIVAGRGGAGPVKFNEDQVQAALARHVGDLKQEGLDAKLQLAEGMAGGAASVIAEIADNEKADLIVAGTTGSGYIAGLLLGSVTQRLAQIAHCPVLVVPSSSAGASTS
jgi:nucleotide-binding universal stress UspA family protein